MVVAAPAFLWTLLLLVPVALFHLYHRRRVVVPFLPLLVEAIGPRRPGGGWRRLRDVVSLVLRGLALILIVLALAGLAPAQAGPTPEMLIVVVDADHTCEAVEADGRTRYAHALVLARALIAETSWSEVAVLEARAAPEVLVPATDETQACRARLSRLLDDVQAGRRRAGPARGDLGAAIDAAQDLARRHLPAPARVRVVSARALDAGAPPVEILGTGAAREDQGIIQFSVARAASGAIATVRVGVRNDAPERRSREVVLRVGELGEEHVEKRMLDLDPGSELHVTFDVAPPAGGAWLIVQLADRDAFAPNDAVHAWLAAPLRPSILLVHDGAPRPYTQAILAAMGETIDVEASGLVRAADLPRAEPRDVTIVDGVGLPEGALRPGAWLFLAPLAGALPFEVGAPVTRPLVWRSAPDHPLVADLDLGEAWIARGFPVSAPGMVSLAEADGETVLAECAADELRYVVLGLDPGSSDLPLRAAFPLLVQAAIRRLAAVPISPLRPFYRAGAPLRPRLPLPGGPASTLFFGQRAVDARLDPAAQGYPVPEGSVGRVTVETSGAPAWTGHTAFVSIDPDLTIVPVRPPATLPRPARPAADASERWRRALLTAAALLLLLDLLLLARLRRWGDGKLDRAMRHA